jgi:hypothetical protein
LVWQFVESKLCFLVLNIVNVFHSRDTDGIISVTPEEMRGIIEVIAETGKFWYYTGPG